MNGIELLRGYKIRLLRAPSRLPWDAGVIPLSGSPRFVPFLLECRHPDRPVELRAYPGPPLGPEERITFLDAAVVGASALFSVLLSPAAKPLLDGFQSLPPALLGPEARNTGNHILSAIYTLKSLFHPQKSGDSPRAEFAKTDEFRLLSYLQDELLSALSDYRGRSHAKHRNRQRELVRAFRAGNLLVTPQLDKDLVHDVREYINSLLGKDECRQTGPMKRGYAKTHGGFVVITPSAPQEKALTLFTACRTPNEVPLFYSDLGARLERYQRALESSQLSETRVGDKSEPCARLLAQAQVLLSIAGPGDFIQMPLLWWGNEARERNYLLFIQHLLSRSTALRFVLFSLAGLFTGAVRDLLQASTNSQFKCPSLGHARRLLEAALAYLYHAKAAESIHKRSLHDNAASASAADATTKLLQSLRSKVEDHTWKAFTKFFLRYRWGDVWGIEETILYAARAPLPKEVHNHFKHSPKHVSDALRPFGLTDAG